MRLNVHCSSHCRCHATWNSGSFLLGTAGPREQVCLRPGGLTYGCSRERVRRLPCRTSTARQTSCRRHASCRMSSGRAYVCHPRRSQRSGVGARICAKGHRAAAHRATAQRDPWSPRDAERCGRRQGWRITGSSGRCRRLCRKSCSEHGGGRSVVNQSSATSNRQWATGPSACGEAAAGF